MLEILTLKNRNEIKYPPLPARPLHSIAQTGFYELEAITENSQILNQLDPILSSNWSRVNNSY